MKIVHENVDGILYVDLLLTPKEIEEIASNEMIDGEVYIKGTQTFFGVRKATEQVKFKEKRWR